MQLIDRYYYPMLNSVLEYIVLQGHTEEDITTYINTKMYDIACQLNEPLCSENLKTDLNTRVELHRALVAIGELFQVL